MLSQPFLTQLDSRAAIKGSRDPLGVQAIWSRLGRHVVGNLTTVSNSAQDFTVLLLGYYWAEKVADEGGTSGDLATFLKWEQLAAYARAHVNRERGFRGTERVAQRLSEERRLRLGTRGDLQILGDQKTYGLWGLYSMPARASGLLLGSPGRLTPPARDLVERVFLPMLEAAGRGASRTVLERLRADESAIDLKKDETLLKAVASVLTKPRAREREVYREHLVYGGPGDRERTGGVQRLFADLLTDIPDTPSWLSPASITALARQARAHGAVGEVLAGKLERIRVGESVIAPAAALFDYVIGCDRQALTDVATDVQARWGGAPRDTIDMAAFELLEPELRAWSDDAESGSRWIRIARALQSGAYEDAILAAFEQNAAVMKARSGAAPWVVLRDGNLDVRFGDERPASLPEGSALPSYWRHAYFIDSLRVVARAVRKSA